MIEKLDNAVEVIEETQKMVVFKRVTQGKNFLMVFYVFYVYFYYPAQIIQFSQIDDAYRTS